MQHSSSIFYINYIAFKVTTCNSLFHVLPSVSLLLISFIHGNLYLNPTPLTFPINSSQLVTPHLFSVSVGVFLFCYMHSFVFFFLFLDST